MRYTEFKEKFLQELEVRCREEGTLHCTPIVKNNDQIRTGVTLIRNGKNMGTTVYVEECYQDYMNHGSFVRSIGDAETMLRMKAPPIITRILEEPEEWKQQIFCHVVRAKQNKKFLQARPYIQKEDLAVCFRVLIGESSLGVMSVGLEYPLFHKLGMEKRDLYEYAMQNTERLFPAKIDVMRDMIILANEKQLFGATSVFYPGLLEKVSQTVGADLYILPSSIHEMIAVPDTGECSEAMLQGIVKTVNQTTMDKSENLTNSVYKYRQKDKTLTRCKESGERTRELEH